MITLQQIFDAAWQAFIVEGKPPAVEYGSCSYLTPDGRKCAVGLTLPEGHECQSDSLRFADLVNGYPELFDAVIRHASDERLNEFQGDLHDELITKSAATDQRLSDTWQHSVEERAALYRDVAMKHGLTVPEIGVAV
jgi:hypothetical protein